MVRATGHANRRQHGPVPHRRGAHRGRPRVRSGWRGGLTQHRNEHGRRPPGRVRGAIGPDSAPPWFTEIPLSLSVIIRQARPVIARSGVGSMRALLLAVTAVIVGSGIVACGSSAAPGSGGAPSGGAASCSKTSIQKDLYKRDALTVATDNP